MTETMRARIAARVAATTYEVTCEGWRDSDDGDDWPTYCTNVAEWEEREGFTSEEVTHRLLDGRWTDPTRQPRFDAVLRATVLATLRTCGARPAPVTDMAERIAAEARATLRSWLGSDGPAWETMPVAALHDICDPNVAFDDAATSHGAGFVDGGDWLAYVALLNAAQAAYDRRYAR